ncbi:MAG: DNA mismatch repair endonuclease MutL [Bacteroidales bacterium]|nr:DNA mismatch repair endonuclease MutL [Bacteroidales bacterium]
MPDIIHLLPDSVANQIAAGEVIQRPASAVKELLENSIDSGADEIKLIIKNAGKSLIRIIDNGCGMSETDARMCFERHATSKIKEANDLFAIMTLGFRGEALASMAAIAQVELKTKRIEDELGTIITIEGAKVKSQEPCACTDGTSISVKNLFFNIPARRKFLKSNTTELRHIIEEFQRVALVNPEIKFSFFNENRQLFLLNKSNIKQRIVALLGSAYNNRLVPVELASEVALITGFIGKPEFARKTRGEQYFFVNGRYIRHPYLNHAVDNAFRELIPSDTFPTYFIYFNVDPKEIDINIHPTKTEINFQNNQVVYSVLNSAIKQALGKFNIIPSIDFNVEQTIDFIPPPKNKEIKPPVIKIDPDYNPFEVSADKSKGFKTKPTTGNWEKLYKGAEIKKTDEQITANSFPEKTQQLIEQKESEKASENNLVFQLHNKYIITSVKSGLMVIDKQRAYERILFEGFLESLSSGKGISQQQLFPETVRFSAGDAQILKEIMYDLKVLGFDIDEFGDNTFIINGAPADMNKAAGVDILENIIENYKKNLKDFNIDKKVNLARSMAMNMAVRYGRKLQQDEIKSLINQLFACKVPEVSPDGKPIVRIITLDELEDKFN